MKQITFFYLVAVLIVVIISNSAQGVINFYSDATIHNGDSFDNVYVWNNAVVDINGGQIDSLDMFNFSEVNLDAGDIAEGIYVWNESTLNMYGGNIGLSLEAADSGIVNLHGGQINDYLYATDSSVVNIYGYNFNYDPDAGGRNGGQLTGFWLDDTSFTIDILDNIAVDSTYYDHVNLVPEPGSLIMICGGCLFLRKRK